jgi:integrase
MGELKDGSLWTIAGSRTKNGAEHDVPLSEPARAVLFRVPRIAGSEFVFTTLGVRPISGHSHAKEYLDKVILQIARQEATEAGQDAGAVTVTPRGACTTFAALRPRGWPAWALPCMS